MGNITSGDIVDDDLDGQFMVSITVPPTVAVLPATSDKNSSIANALALWE